MKQDEMKHDKMQDDKMMHDGKAKTLESGKFHGKLHATSGATLPGFPERLQFGFLPRSVVCELIWRCSGRRSPS
jgi:hypothetical protein